MKPIILSRTGDFELDGNPCINIPRDLTYIIRDEACILYQINQEPEYILQEVLEYLRETFLHIGDEELEDYIPDTIGMALQYAASISKETFFEWLKIFRNNEQLREYYFNSDGPQYEGLDDILFNIYNDDQHFYDYQEINRGAQALYMLLT